MTTITQHNIIISKDERKSQINKKLKTGMFRASQPPVHPSTNPLSEGVHWPRQRVEAVWHCLRPHWSRAPVRLGQPCSHPWPPFISDRHEVIIWPINWPSNRLDNCYQQLPNNHLLITSLSTANG